MTWACDLDVCEVLLVSSLLPYATSCCTEYGGSVQLLQGSLANHLGVARGVLSTLLSVFTCLVVLTEREIARLLEADKREYWRRRRRVGGFAGVDAGGKLASGD